MQNLYLSEQVRSIDAAAVQAGTPGIVLMKRAGRVAFDRICTIWPDLSELIILCGGGNNGGDGYIVASLAAQADVTVKLFYAKEFSALTGEAKLAADEALLANVECLPITCLQDLCIESHSGQVIVDALLGTGFASTAPRLAYSNAIQWCNRQPAPVVALDVPSALNADTGVASSPAVNADLTLCFIALKQGMYTADGPAHCGRIELDSLLVPEELINLQRSGVALLEPEYLLPKLQRYGNSHKGHSGRAAIVAGDHGMAGAALLAAEACVYSGAGLITLYTRGEHVQAANVRVPEVMARACDNLLDFKKQVEAVNAIAIGPGMGQSDWAAVLLTEVLKQSVPCVIDADALNLIAREIVPFQAVSSETRQERIFTPHPGEASRLLSCSSSELQQDRFTAVAALQDKLGGIVVLKGAGTLISNGKKIWVCDKGNAGMAVGGMGDVLSGLIAALLAQKLSALEAALLGVWLHSKAADILAEEVGILGLKASELFPYIRQCLNAKKDIISG